ncbi:MAG TPA: ROK family protein, partial [Pilimelia sp.]|nr:ROK family protein [Pilimelia sp.]
VNHVTGRIVGSAPLWGPAVCDFDMAAALRRACPGIRWTVINDVTALATALIKDLAGARGPAAAVTVSSGIGYRTIDLDTGEIPTDRRHGLQGEIGHLPVELFWQGRRLHARCDCGADRHLASFSSGPGIVRLLTGDPDLGRLTAEWTSSPAADNAQTEAVFLAAFAQRVHAGDPTAQLLLDLVTQPLAQVLLYQATLNPQVAPTVVTGGVAAGFGPTYRDSLLRNLARMPLYGVSHRGRDHFTRQLRLGPDDGLCALRGAGVRARGSAADDDSDGGRTPWSAGRSAPTRN